MVYIKLFHMSINLDQFENALAVIELSMRFSEMPPATH